MSILNLDAAVPFATFENAGLLYYYGDYREGGYKLTSSRADKIKFIYWDEARAANLGMHHDGSGVLANPAYESVTLTDLHNQTFGLGSIDLDTQWGIWGEIEVTFYGTTATGVVTHSVMLDTENGMEKVDLPDSFSAVTAVAWRTDEPSNILFDNIEVSHAPLVAADTTVTLVEGSPAIALGIAPPGDIDGDDLAITVTAIPDAAMGDIELADGGAVAVGDTLSAEQLAGLIFTATAHSPGAAGSFSYEVSDGIARASQTIALDIAPSGEPPATTIGLWASATGPGAPGAGAPHDAYWTRPVRADDPRVTHTTAETGGVTQETIALDAPWNAIKNIAVSTLAAADLTVSGFVDVKIDADDGAAHSLHVEDAKRGEIVTGGGSDRVAVTYRPPRRQGHGGVQQGGLRIGRGLGRHPALRQAGRRRVRGRRSRGDSDRPRGLRRGQHRRTDPSRRRAGRCRAHAAHHHRRRRQPCRRHQSLRRGDGLGERARFALGMTGQDRRASERNGDTA